jgi:alpha-tubulin suppressor-like RCC1 family protein
LALLNDGEVEAWGLNSGAKLGYGEPEGFRFREGCDGIWQCSRHPEVVPGVTDVTAVSAGNDNSFALLANGHVMAWGYNGLDGSLGDGTTMTVPSNAAQWEAVGLPFPNEKTSVPVEVSNLSDVVSISSDGAHTLALLSNGHVEAWGYNRVGSLGLGDTQSRDAPVEVPELSGVVAIAAGWDDSLALLANGHVEAWGWNHYGELGDGESGYTAWTDRPTEVKELTEVRAIATGGEHSLAYGSRPAPESPGEKPTQPAGVGATAQAPTGGDSPVVPSAAAGTHKTTHSRNRRGHKHARARRARARHHCACSGRGLLRRRDSAHRATRRSG